MIIVVLFRKFIRIWQNRSVFKFSTICIKIPKFSKSYHFLDNEKMYNRALRYITGELDHHLNDIPYPAGPSTHTTIKTATSNQ